MVGCGGLLCLSTKQMTSIEPTVFDKQRVLQTDEDLHPWVGSMSANTATRTKSATSLQLLQSPIHVTQLKRCNDESDRVVSVCVRIFHTRQRGNGEVPSLIACHCHCDGVSVGPQMTWIPRDPNWRDTWGRKFASHSLGILEMSEWITELLE